MRFKACSKIYFYLRAMFTANHNQDIASDETYNRYFLTFKINYAACSMVKCFLSLSFFLSYKYCYPVYTADVRENTESLMYRYQSRREITGVGLSPHQSSVCFVLF